jgi:hypothetical protein
LIARPVHEHLLARLVLLAQHHIQLAPPLLVEFAKPAIAETFRIRLFVFLPEQLQRQMAMPLPLLMDLCKIGCGLFTLRFDLRRGAPLADGERADSNCLSSHPLGNGHFTPAAVARCK